MGCLAAVSRFAGTLEKQYGIPTVSLSNEKHSVVRTGAHFKYSTGMPIRFVGVPYPFTGLKKEALKTYLRWQGQGQRQACDAGDRRLSDQAFNR